MFLHFPKYVIVSSTYYLICWDLKPESGAQSSSSSSSLSSLAPCLSWIFSLSNSAFSLSTCSRDSSSFLMAAFHFISFFLKSSTSLWALDLFSSQFRQPKPLLENLDSLVALSRRSLSLFNFLFSSWIFLVSSSLRSSNSLSSFESFSFSLSSFLFTSCTLAVSVLNVFISWLRPATMTLSSNYRKKRFF